MHIGAGFKPALGSEFGKLDLRLIPTTVSRGGLASFLKALNRFSSPLIAIINHTHCLALAFREGIGLNKIDLRRYQKL